MAPKFTHPKAAMLNAMLDQGRTYIVCAGLEKDVVVPDKVRHVELYLALSWRFRGSMALADHGVEAELAFSGPAGPLHKVTVPWGRIFAMYHRGKEGPYNACTWPADIPQRAHAPGPPPRVVDEAEAARPAAAAPSDGLEPAPPTPPRRGHLKLVQ